jgi:hypothetical protein
MDTRHSERQSDNPDHDCEQRRETREKRMLVRCQITPTGDVLCHCRTINWR